MLIVEKNSVYEIDEECVRRRNVPAECGVYQKLVQKRAEEAEAAQKNPRSVFDRGSR